MALGPKWYAPPAKEPTQDPLADSVDPARIRYAGVGIRVAARFVDAIVVLFLWTIGGFLGGLGFALVGATAGAHASTRAGVVGGDATALFVGFSIGWLVYCSVSEALGDATLGKWLCALRVRSESLRACTVPRAIARNLLFTVDLILLTGALVAGASKKRQRLGDLVASTVVVNATTLPSASLRAPGTACVVACMTTLVVYVATLLIDLTR